MTVITVKDQSPTEQILSSLKTWQRDAKKSNQTGLYDLQPPPLQHPLRPRQRRRPVPPLPQLLVFQRRPRSRPLA